MQKYFVRGGVLLLALNLSVPADAHVAYADLTHVGSAEGFGFVRNGWISGTRAILGDSHDLNSSNFFKFTLTQPSLVNLSFGQINTAGGAIVTNGILDPAFSLYSGLLPSEAHDDSGYDPLGTGGRSMSPTDAVPGDPGIGQYKWQTNTFSFVANPDWTVSFSTLAANPAYSGHAAVQALAVSHPSETPAQWYAAAYVPHGGFRDLLNYTDTGGLQSSGYPANPYAGQFDALSSWSMANDSAIIGDPVADVLALGDWDKIIYLTHVNEHVTTLDAAGDAVGTINDTPESLVNYYLPAGSYTIAASGASCLNSGDVLCVSGGLGGRMTFSATPVPVPAAIWLFLSALGGVLGWGSRRKG